MAVDVAALPTTVPGVIPNGVWTIINESGGTHRTVKVETVEDNNGLRGKRIIYLMNGPDNVWNYVGVAFLETKFSEVEEEYQEDEEYQDVETVEEEMTFEGMHDDCMFTFEHEHKVPTLRPITKTRSVTKTRTIIKPTDEVVVWKRLKGTQEHKIIDAWFKIITVGIPGTRFELAKHCIKCNRLLTNPESIDAGIGPVCAQGGMDVG